MKIAIVGMADSRDQAPWANSEWSLWGLAWDWRRYEFARAFEIHDALDIEAGQPQNYAEALADLALIGSLIVLDETCVKGATLYPLQAVVGGLGLDYFSSSVAYMLALAIHEGHEEISLFGVDCDPGSEYAYQKANMEYLIGLARGRGIRVNLPDGCPLCRYVNPHGFDFVGGYGRRK